MFSFSEIDFILQEYAHRQIVDFKRFQMNLIQFYLELEIYILSFNLWEFVSYAVKYPSIFLR